MIIRSFLLSVFCAVGFSGQLTLTAQEDVEFDFTRAQSQTAAEDAQSSFSGDIDFDSLAIDPSEFGGASDLPTDLMDFEGNPDALNNASTDPELQDLLNRSMSNGVTDGGFDDFVSGLIGGQPDPFDITGFDEPVQSDECRVEEVARDDVRRSEYVCSIDDFTGLEQPSCNRVLVHPTDDDYIYECDEVRIDTLAPWQGDCEPLDSDAGCEQTGEVCNQEADPVPERFECQTGQTGTDSTESCEENLVQILDADFEYKCRRTWNVDHWEYSPECDSLIAANCTETGGECVVEGPPVFDEYTCETGPGSDARTETCSSDLQVDIDEDYLYACEQTWNPVTRRWDYVNPDTCQAAASNCTRVENWSCDTGGEPNVEDRYCERGQQLSDTPESCQQDLLHRVDFNFDYQCSEIWDLGSGTFVPDPACTTLAATPGCTRGSSACVVTRDFPTVKETCLTGEALGSEARTCELPIVHQIDTDYVYECVRTFDAGSQTHVDGATCGPLKSNSECTFQSETCTQASPPTTQVYTCRHGERTEPRDESFERNLRVEVDLDYVYRCYEDFNTSTSQWIQDAACGRLSTTSYCEETTSSCVTNSPGVFSEHTCETGYRIDEESASCDAPLEISVDIDYGYDAVRSWNGSTHEPSYEHSRLVQHGCEIESQSCTTASPGVFSQHTCQQGWHYVPENRTCSRPLTVTVDVDYEYQATRDWNGSAFANSSALNRLNSTSGCSQTNSRCTQASPGVFGTYKCNRGYVADTENRTCNRVLNVTASQSYRHICRWVQRNNFEPFTWFEMCPHLSENATCRPSGQQQCALGQRGQYRCSHDVICGSQTVGHSNGIALTPTINESWDQSSCNTLEATCTGINEQCIEGPSTKVINGVSVYKTCWNYRRTYRCNTESYRDNCSLPSGAQEVRQTCTRYNGSTCRDREYEYRYPLPDPSGGCHQYTHTFRCENAVSGVGSPTQTFRSESGSSWNMSQCNSTIAGGRCNGSPQVRCVEGAATRTINGLSVYKSCWRQELTYSCSPRQDVDTCNPPSGSTLKSETCAWSDAGTCRLFNRVYEREEPDPSGGCHEYTDRFRCENTVSLVGQPARTYRDITAEAFNRATCGPLSSDAACTKVRTECLSGPETRTINGLEVTRDCWEERDVYSCDRRTDIDTCTPPAGSVLDSETCLWQDSGSTCRLFQRVYKKEEADPSGGCHRTEKRYRCEDVVGGIPLPIDTLRNIEREFWDNGDTESDLQGQGCVETAETCVSGPATRTINGLAVTRDCWRTAFTYTCEDSVPFDGCEPESNCAEDSEVCVETNSDGSCAIYEKSYICTVDDGSGGCQEFTSNYRCENQVSGAGPVVDTIREAGPGVFDENLCAAHMADVGCVQASERCIDSSPTTRNVSGVSVSETCWRKERTYNCETSVAFDDCTGFDHCTLSSEVCAETKADGSCANYERTYDCPVDDGSGGCAEQNVNYTCSATVPAAGSPTQINVSNIGSELWDERCIGSYPQGLCVEQSSSCLTGAGSNTVRPVVTQAQLEVDPGLADLLGLSGATAGTGRPDDLGLAEGVFRVNDSLLGALPSVLSSCDRREITYGCETATAVDTCGEYEDDQQASLFLGNPMGAMASIDDQRRIRSIDTLGASAWTERGQHDALLFMRALQKGLLHKAQFGGQRCHYYIDPGCTIDPEIEPCDIYPELCDPTYDPPPIPNEGDATQCVFQDEECVETSRTGECVRHRRRYACSVEDGSQGCAERSDLWRCDVQLPNGEVVDTVYAPGDQVFDWSGCDTLEDSPLCVKNGEPYCTDDSPRSRDIGQGVIAEADCWQLTQDYSCGAVAPPAGCSPAAGCSLRDTTCTTRDVDGTCLVEERRYECPGDDGSGGCAEAEDTYQCEDPVDGAGTITDVVITVVDTQWETDPNCTSDDGDRCVPETETVCTTDYATPQGADRIRWRDEFLYNSCDIGERRECWGINPTWPVVTGCQTRTRNYQCTDYSDVNTCPEPIPSGCQLASTVCAETNRLGACVLETFEYTCDARPGGCVDRTRTFLCEDLVDGAGPPDDTVTEVLDPYWDESECDPFLDEELGCVETNRTCTAGPSTRQIAAQEISAQCWNERVDYTCEDVGELATDCDPPEDCELVSELCIEDDPDPTIGCRSFERTYSCEFTTTSTVEEEVCGESVSCFNGTCTAVDMQESQDMPEALAQLSALGQAHEGEGATSASLRLMGGDDLRCHKSGFLKNCCSGGGLLNNLFGSSCNEEEQELAHRRSENQCVYVGTYCAKKGFFGCRKRKRTFCCFGSELAKVVNEQGNQQLGLGWGSAKNPQCDGMTPAQFAQLDFSNIDFSEILADVTSGFGPPGEGTIEDRIRDRVSNFYTQGSSTSCTEANPC
mgnify:CR=1 FL=1